MTFIKKILSRFEKKENISTDGFQSVVKNEWDSFNELVEYYAGITFEKQRTFGDIIESNSWQFDMQSGSISFGEKLSFPVQVIGSLSFNDYTWMWSWANSKSEIPEKLLRQSLLLKELGQKKNIEELTNAHFDVDSGFEHKIGMIASGVFDSKSYYCANYGQGTLVLTIDSNKIPDVNPEKIENIVKYFPQLINSVELNHKSALINYFFDKEIMIKEEENTVLGLKNGKLISARFDDSSRLKKITLKG